jgi:hypothetical protein
VFAVPLLAATAAHGTCTTRAGLPSEVPKPNLFQPLLFSPAAPARLCTHMFLNGIISQPKAALRLLQTVPASLFNTSAPKLHNNRRHSGLLGAIAANHRCPSCCWPAAASQPPAAAAPAAAAE